MTKYGKFVGIDEVGRGAWAGPLVVGAVNLAVHIEGLNDSKALNSEKRIILAKIILDKASFLGLGWASNAEVDKYGLTGALSLASKRALRKMNFQTEIILDGNVNYLPKQPNVKCIIRADQKFPEVMAASIVAKVARDNYMAKFAKEYPDFGFEKNVGYGTFKHSEALKKHGITRLHRHSFKPVKLALHG